ncbi:hypothetical protein TSUD_24390 [Trifolium subterraneum]|uniref:Uncharacterized protein n=1 Tax=Trifolium subterraneum TaxID=3900 RepID=A0A2Z6PAW7_TRISU|nr:hypothetical protein TSUD_24390 [Trifolium subterraneum]
MEKRNDFWKRFLRLNGNYFWNGKEERDREIVFLPYPPGNPRFRELSSVPTCAASVAIVCTGGSLASQGLPTDESESFHLQDCCDSQNSYDIYAHQ